MGNDTLNTLSLQSLQAALEDLVVDSLAIEDFPLTGLCFDSRVCSPGNCFFALKGTRSDGRTYLAEAERRGAKLVIAESRTDSSIPTLVVRNARKALARAAAFAHAYPSRELKTIAVTGTNGKSSVSWILSHLLSLVADKSALVGTLGSGPVSAGKFQGKKSSLTTPDALSFQRFLRGQVAAGATSVVFEASSHALDQCRVDSIDIDAAVFTNLSRDHLDYHQNEEAYFQAKKRLFSELLETNSRNPGIAIVNLDDSAGARLVLELDLGERMIRVSPAGQAADLRVHERALALDKTRMLVEYQGAQCEFTSMLAGDFAVENISLALATLLALGFRLEQLQGAVESVPPVPGRLEVVRRDPCQVVVDFAHTPAALKRTLETLRPLTEGKLVCVFGCGGNRDTGKRPEMGQVAFELADEVFITSDNPRDEEPEQILQDIRAGIPEVGNPEQGAVRLVVDRKQAIREALAARSSEDVVLVAGKGHEEGIEIRGQTVPYSDRTYISSV